MLFTLAFSLLVSATAIADVGVGADVSRRENERIQKESSSSEKSRDTGSRGESRQIDRETRAPEQSRDRGESRQAESRPSYVDAKRADEARVKEMTSKPADRIDAKRADEAKVKEMTTKPDRVDAKRADEAKVKQMTYKPDRVDAKRADESKVKEVIANNEAKQRIRDVVKPPFSATPRMQPLNPNLQQSDTANTTPTKNSSKGGYPGPLRSGGKKNHYGVDEETENRETDVTYYTGPVEGTVIAVKEHPEYGKWVTIQFTTDDGAVWTSKTMHHREILVKKDQKVGPGQAVAVGGGYGNQFKSKEAGKPHVHWEVTRDGKTVNPLSGEILREPKNKAGSPAQPTRK